MPVRLRNNQPSFNAVTDQVSSKTGSTQETLAKADKPSTPKKKLKKKAADDKLAVSVSLRARHSLVRGVGTSGGPVILQTLLLQERANFRELLGPKLYLA